MLRIWDFSSFNAQKMEATDVLAPEQMAYDLQNNLNQSQRVQHRREADPEAILHAREFSIRQHIISNFSEVSNLFI